MRTCILSCITHFPHNSTVDPTTPKGGAWQPYGYSLLNGGMEQRLTMISVQLKAGMLCPNRLANAGQADRQDSGREEG